MAEHIRAGGSRREISADLDNCQQNVAVLMVNRYADEAEANSFRRAEELRPKCESRRSAPKLAAEGDHAGGLSGVGSQSRSISLPTRRDH